MEKKDILCPDCETNYITNTRYTTFGKCMSCYRREVLAKSSGISYVMFKDLPDDEKVRITRQREIKRNSYVKRKNNNKKGIIEVSEMENLSSNKNNNNKGRAGRPQIYTPELIEEIKTVANSNITPSELLGILKGLHPELPLTPSNLNNIISRHNIPHSSSRGKKPKKIEAEIESISTNDEIVLQDEQENSEDIIDIVEPTIQEDKVVENNSIVEVNHKVDIDNDEPERFKPIRAEIDNLLDTKFRRMNCSLDKDYTIDDYINMIEMLIYLKNNRDTIIKNRRSQQNIMNAYQSDTLHEMENAILEDGNTYLSDKMHILRKYRRYYESDYKNVSILKPLLEILNSEVLEKIYDALKRNKNYTDNPVFKPLVDTTMVTKYDWAKSMDLSSAKSNISITHYNPNDFNQGNNNGRPVTRIGIPEKTPPTSQLNGKMRKSLKVFRVSCKVSGGGYGAFKEWYRDYECTNSNTALSYATNTLNQLAANRKGMYWTDLGVVELNV